MVILYHTSDYSWAKTFLKTSAIRRHLYGGCGDNTVEENSSIFSLICMHWLPSARACGQ